MSVDEMIRRVCSPCRAVVHQTRAQCIEDVAVAIARGGRLSPASVGRSLRGSALPKHAIKRVDRLLGNTKVHRHRWRYYEAIAQRVLGNSTRPVVAIDWSGTVKGQYTLAAATPIGGRAITLYAEVWPQEKYTSRLVQQQFLATLRKVLGDKRRPIIIADAGFRGPFIHAVKQLGWDYVTRIRGPLYVRRENSETWVRSTTFHDAAGRRPVSLGTYQLTRERSSYVTPQVITRIVLGRKPRKKKMRRRKSRAPISGQDGGRGILSGAKEPWLLATSLDETPARIVELYALRMQIEETFRDHKNPRFGWCLRHVQSRCHHRLTTLLMLAAIAMLAVSLIGIAAERANLHWQYQANTTRRRVLSFFCLGRALIARNDTRARPDTSPRASPLAAHL